ncbi:LysR family transcriptional regulator [Mangrovicoccus sp. HB161399]|uniref:LysR family transcriptional regulator n=1 Tax=Mangrovicoccus sp. HB161399 TaxID=2720392 RepID=UPI0015575DCF|nr:LysR family transcriptional regulator [Mangrovicoccus sp. HB161399]
MDIQKLRCFAALAETLHFGQAAERMNMTQPPFSRQIAGLERALGVTLVERSSRRVALTPAGERFQRDARAVLARFESACRDARLVAEGQTGELRLGFMMHAAHRLVPRMVAAYAARRPEVRITLAEATPEEIEERLIRGQLDAGVTFAGAAVPQLESLPIFRDRLCLALPPGHRLAGRTEAAPEDLRDEDLIAVPDRVSRTLRGEISRWFAQAGLVPRVRFEPQLQQTILRLVAEGLGTALVPASICDRQADVATVPLAAAPALDVVLRTRRGAGNPALAPLLEIIRQGGLTAP